MKKKFKLLSFARGGVYSEAEYYDTIEEVHANYKDGDLFYVLNNDGFYERMPYYSDLKRSDFHQFF